MDIEFLRPTERRLIIDLVRDAGIDVSDWSNYGGRVKPPAANPKYCYEWAFVQAPDVIVLNVWFPDIYVEDDTMLLSGNMKRRAESQIDAPVRRKRAAAFDNAVRLAWTDRIPLRLVICAGQQRRPGAQAASRVHSRLLDSVTWYVRDYAVSSGEFILARGPLEHRVVDQFDVGDPEVTAAETRSITGVVYVRSSEVRRAVLTRAAGYCEWCDEPGFSLPAGDTYLETHHIVPLSEKGSDTPLNVAALCPNHHREAHYGSSRIRMRTELLRIVSKRGLTNR